ncbi:cation diffusion facilitator family transporter [uncultured Methanobrevibacter sp.]|uniref:cation diffusion facilitator family transporter n=1 Tax=uncultured Methanobrevibacter sp. TaxID=253161 RepID=UPI0025FDD96D|nr:cation diffusion facilitator family transporter [uncultured Methanobrevibacter sp.]
MDNETRNKKGKRAFLIALIGNVFLTFFNITIGYFSGSYALIAEGTHTLSDIATSVIAYVGFKIASKPADSDHPLGHGRAEAIGGLLIVLFLAIVSYEIIEGAVTKLFFSNHIVSPSYLAGFMAVIGIIVNIIMSQSIISIGNKVHSPAIVADGKHQRVDVLSSFVILISVILSNFGFPQIDPIVGLAIGLSVLKVAIEVAMDNINHIMGKLPSQELLDDIKQVVLAVDGVEGIHDIRADFFGSYATVTFHIELPEDLTFPEAHKIVHIVQDEVEEKIDVIYGATVHACPTGLNYDHKKKIDKIKD